MQNYLPILWPTKRSDKKDEPSVHEPKEVVPNQKEEEEDIKTSPESLPSSFTIHSDPDSSEVSSSHVSTSYQGSSTTSRFSPYRTSTPGTLPSSYCSSGSDDLSKQTISGGTTGSESTYSQSLSISPVESISSTYSSNSGPSLSDYSNPEQQYFSCQNNFSELLSQTSYRPDGGFFIGGDKVDFAFRY